MNVVLDETVLRMAEFRERPVRPTRNGVEWGGFDVMRRASAEGDLFVVTTTERGKTRVDFTTDDDEVLDHYLLVQFGESMRMSRGLPIVLTDRYPPVPDEFQLRENPRGTS